MVNNKELNTEPLGFLQGDGSQHFLDITIYSEMNTSNCRSISLYFVPEYYKRL